MSKIYNIPLDKGYAGKNSQGTPDFPSGYWTGKNMIYREDGALRCRYSYVRISNGVIGGADKNIVDVFSADGNFLAICSDMKPYYHGTSGNSWTECNWQGGGQAPNINIGGYTGKWGWLDANPVYTNSYNYPLRFSSSGQNYNYLTGGTGDSFQSRYIIDHQNRLLLASLTTNGARIVYSEVDDPDSGYTSNYVNVGDEIEEITGIHSVGGNLIVLKRNTIWAKLGTYSDLTSDQFQPIMYGVSALPHSSIVGRDVLYFSDHAGAFAFIGGSAQNISTPLGYEWSVRSNYNTCFSKFGYWKYRDWLWVTDGEGAGYDRYSTPLVYDVKRGVWYRFEGFTPQCFTDLGNNLYFGQEGTTDCAYLFRYGVDIDGGLEDTIDQELQTPFLDLGSPFAEKYIRKIHLNATGIDQVDVYMRNTPSVLEYDDPTYTIESPADGEVINFDSSEKFREISIKLTGDGDMVVKGMAVEFEERR
ncbi:MAG: hypothetical protein K8T10_16260 [Candidatus Eremiobacteraeota bacterium]|nr:hypothetical protein [Candidatus Eremiobacteraeota bacterium]